ncbi:MAG: hypothetical protein AAF899_11705 [Pseudomonadota bacterium]
MRPQSPTSDDLAQAFEGFRVLSHWLRLTPAAFRQEVQALRNHLRTGRVPRDYQTAMQRAIEHLEALHGEAHRAGGRSASPSPASPNPMQTWR